jgi:hypothetical protein
MAVTVGEINARLLRQRFQLLRAILGQQQPVENQFMKKFSSLKFIFRIPILCANVYVQKIL